MKQIFRDTVGIAQIKNIGLFFGELAASLFADMRKPDGLPGAFGILVTTAAMDTKDIFRAIDPKKVTDVAKRFAGLDLASEPDTEYAAAMIDVRRVDDLATAFRENRLTIDAPPFGIDDTSAVILIRSTNASPEIAKLFNVPHLHEEERVVLVAGWRATTVVKNLAEGREVASGDLVKHIYEATMAEYRWRRLS